jgi:hypothetical protein
VPRACNRYTPCGLVSPRAQTIPQHVFLTTVHEPAGKKTTGKNAAGSPYREDAHASLWEWLRSAHGDALAGGGTLRITGPVSDGFWVRALWVFAHASWSKAVGLNISVEYRSALDTYLNKADKVDDGFSQYFEPLRKDQPPDATTLLLQLDCFAAARLWERVGNYALTYAELIRQRFARSQLVDELPLKPRLRHVAEADFFWRSQRLGDAQGADATQRVLGVHLRGTDKRCSPRANPPPLVERSPSAVSCQALASTCGAVHAARARLSVPRAARRRLCCDG